MTRAKVFIEWNKKVRFHWRLLYDKPKSEMHLNFGEGQREPRSKDTETPPFYMTQI